MKRRRTPPPPPRHSWSHLSQCLVELILKPLTLPDRVRFGSVCRSWRGAQLECLDAPAPPLPFLIIADIIRKDKNDIIQLFSFSDKRTYKLSRLRARLAERYSSSSQGWLLTNSPRGLVLFNPFSKTANRIHQKNFEFRDSRFFSTQLYSGGFLFFRESNINRFIIYTFNYLDSQHSRIEVDAILVYKWEKVVVSNVILRGEKFYALYEDGSLAVVDVSNLPRHNIPITNEKMELKREYSPLGQWRRQLVRRIYVLVESCGEILMVMIKPSKGCQVFRADLTNKEWVEVKDLGDRMLFITDASSVSVSARETGGKGNIIYYIPYTDKFFEGQYVEFDLNTNSSIIHQIPARDGLCLVSLIPGFF